jgi:hypothetical protein
MSEFILPRLTPDRISDLMSQVQELDVEKLARAAKKRRASEGTFAVLGRQNIDDDALGELRADLVEIATRYGYPGAAARNRTRFDVEAAIRLHESIPAPRGELLRREVWQYFSCALAPDVSCWRWRRKDGVISSERFDGGVRDCFGRLWRRADVLKDDRLKDPWTLVRALGEDNVTTIIERPKVARHRLLVREASRAYLLRREIVKGADLESAEEALLRQMMLMLTRRGAHLAYSALEHDELVAAVADIADSAVKAFGVTPLDEKRLLSRFPELAIIAPPAAFDATAAPHKKRGRG